MTPETRRWDILRWLEEKGVRPQPGLAYLLLYLFDHGEDPSWEDVRSKLGISPSTARFWCTKKRLPTPVQWTQLARCLYGARRMREDPTLTMAELASQMGFEDHSGLAHLLRRTCGIRFREIRALPDEWEFLLLDCWLEKQRTKSRRSLVR